MVQVILAEDLIEALRARADRPAVPGPQPTTKFLRASDFGETGDEAERTFYIWDEKQQPVKAAATGYGAATGRMPDPTAVRFARSAIEGRRSRASGRSAPQGSGRRDRVYARPARAVRRRVHPPNGAGDHRRASDNVRSMARTFAKSGAGMIYSGYRSAKWLHGDSCTAPGC